MELRLRFREHDGVNEPPDVEAFVRRRSSIEPDAERATVPTPRSGSLRSRAAAWSVAVGLSIVLPGEVMAAPRPELPPVQVPDPERDPGSEAAPEPASETEPEEDPAATYDPSETPPVSLPAPAPALDSPSSVDQATIDAAWEGVDGFDVELELKGGGSMRGHVGAVQADTFTLIQAKTGAVLVLPKSSVVSLRVRTPPPLPTNNGGGALAGGAVLTTLGAPVFITGVTFLAVCSSCTALHVPMLLLGGGALGGGIPLLVRGARQRRAYNDAMQERALAPVVFRTPHGWTGGIRFRF